MASTAVAASTKLNEATPELPWFVYATLRLGEIKGQAASSQNSVAAMKLNTAVLIQIAYQTT